MADFYDRLEAQLADATERGVSRRRVAVRWTVPRLRADLVAVALAVAVTVLVAAAFIGIGASDRNRQRAASVTNGLPVLRNYPTGKLPPLPGQMVCNTTLSAPGGAKSPSATAQINNLPPTRYVLRIRASGLKPNVNGSVYEVWIEQGQTAMFIGVIDPVVGRDGTFAAQGLLPQDASGGELVVTEQPTASAKTPGRTVLKGPISF